MKKTRRAALRGEPTDLDVSEPFLLRFGVDVDLLSLGVGEHSNLGLRVVLWSGKKRAPKEEKDQLRALARRSKLAKSLSLHPSPFDSSSTHLSQPQSQASPSTTKIQDVPSLSLVLSDDGKLCFESVLLEGVLLGFSEGRVG